MKTGDRIYYTGDMANIESEGAITRMVDNGYGKQCDIVLDDGRLLRGISLLGFEPCPGRRFWLLSEWEEDRARRIAEMQARYVEMGLLELPQISEPLPLELVSRGEAPE